MKRKIKSGIAKGVVKAPPSKSYAHRLLIAAALANGESEIKGISKSADMEATLNCIKALGREFTKTGDTVCINGKINEGELVFNCLESGSTLRFMIPIALLTGHRCKFTGSARLMERGVEVYEQAFKERGITISKNGNELFLDGQLKPDTYSMPGNVSSQYISGLLFALPLLNGDSVLNLTTPLESAPYVDITIECLKTFGVEIVRGNNSYYIRGNQSYKPLHCDVTGDYSNAAFLDGFNLLGGDVSVFGLNSDSLQGDKVYLEYYEQLKNGNPVIDISNCPDLGPVLFALASVRNGATFTGTKRLKIKESDRAEAMKTELSKMGVCLDVQENSVVVGCGAKAPTEELYGHNDHRIVMALSLLLSRFGGVIDGCEAVCKSYPDFFEDMASLGIESEII